MKRVSIVFTLAAAAALSLHSGGGEPRKPAVSKPKLAVSIKPQHLADALRTVILSDREVYAQLTAEQHSASGRSDQNGPSSNKPLPSPCELLETASQTVASKGVEFSYVLRSLTPINKRNAPETETEVKGLQFVSSRPDLSYASEELLGGRWYFTAVYPDVALSQSCVACHSRLQPGSKKELKVGDVIGALVVRIALEL